MQLYQTEQEQVEALKRWWKENGKAVIAGVLIGISLGFALWAWRTHTQNQAELASVEYQLLLGEVEKGDAEAGLKHGTRIINQYRETPYAVLAALGMAKLEMEKGSNSAARKYLEWAMDNADDTNIQHLARVRLARVLLNSKQPQAALKLISSVDQGSFVSDYEELKGDIYVAMDRSKPAQAAYKKALSALGDSNADKKALLRMKLGDLGASPNKKEKAS